MPNKKDDAKEGMDKEMQEIFSDLGKNLSRLMQKLAEKGEEFRKKLEEGQGIDIGGLEDLFRSFGFESVDVEFKAEGGKRATATKERAPIRVLEPVVDVFDEEDEVLIYVELPGVKQEDIKTQMSGRTLRVEAEHADGRYRKTIQIPESAKGMPSYSYKNGILKVRFSKKAEEDS